MERIAAVKKLSKMLGKGFGYRINIKAPDKEERAAAKLELPAARAEFEALRKQRDARAAELMATDKEYQALQAAHKAARERITQINSKAYGYKITVGNSVDLAPGFGAFHVKAEGDSWEEVIAKLQKKGV